MFKARQMNTSEAKTKILAPWGWTNFFDRQCKFFSDLLKVT